MVLLPPLHLVDLAVSRQQLRLALPLLLLLLRRHLVDLAVNRQQLRLALPLLLRLLLRRHLVDLALSQQQQPQLRRPLVVDLAVNRLLHQPLRPLVDLALLLLPLRLRLVHLAVLLGGSRHHNNRNNNRNHQ